MVGVLHFDHSNAQDRYTLTASKNSVASTSRDPAENPLGIFGFIITPFSKFVW